MNKDALPRPRAYWQTEPCPPWCGFTADHTDADAVEDRNHVSGWEGTVRLSLVDPSLEDLRDGCDEPEYAAVHVVQHYRECTPRIWLGQSQTNTGWYLTVDEAREIAEQLTQAADLAEGHWGGA